MTRAALYLHVLEWRDTAIGVAAYIATLASYLFLAAWILGFFE